MRFLRPKRVFFSIGSEGWTKVSFLKTAMLQPSCSVSDPRGQIHKPLILKEQKFIPFSLQQKLKILKKLNT